MLRLPFEIEATAPGSRARAGRLSTRHGEVATPIFMPVGTQGAVRSQTWEQLESIGAPIVLANTYHLHLRPGPETLRALGGLHGLTGWRGALLTDSGGFQIFSLPAERALTEAGARFRSRIDGSEVLLSPETSIATQLAIGSDVMMALDQCIPSTAGPAEARAAMELTHRWARRSLAARGDAPNALYGIVQGACHAELRRESAAALTAMEFDGYAIGGLAVGETKAEREDVTELVTELLPFDRPRYLMGVGTPLDLLEAVHRGVDQFDCILPTQVAQRGTAYTARGPRQLRRGAYARSEEPLDPDCACATCRRHSRAYLHHLIRCDEPLGWTLIAHHNLHFYLSLMREARARIIDGTFADFYRDRREALAAPDTDYPVKPPRAGRVAKSRRLSLGAFRLVENATGHASVAHEASGEIMHSVNDPHAEARTLYVEQGRLARRLRGPEGDPLVVWDVGLGAAINAMAAIAEAEAPARVQESEAPAGNATSRPLRPLELISFERDLDALRLALWHPERFPHLRHPGPASLLRSGEWRSPDRPIRWRLLEGDFRRTLEVAPLPSLVFYDPFSYKTDGELWTAAHFEALRRRFGEAEVELFTYSASTAVRAALLLTGFFVGEGVGTGPKSATSVAATRPEALRRPLGADWLARWSRSGAPFPADSPRELWPELRKRLIAHPQFASLGDALSSAGPQSEVIRSP
jgi:queuine tRNA-ribosyltransferase